MRSQFKNYKIHNTIQPTLLMFSVNWLPFLTSFLSCLQIVLENSSREDKHECPFGRSSIELTKMLCEILKVGELRKYPHFPQGMKLGRHPASGGAHLQAGFPRCWQLSMGIVPMDRTFFNSGFPCMYFCMSALGINTKIYRNGKMCRYCDQI